MTSKPHAVPCHALLTWRQGLTNQMRRSSTLQMQRNMLPIMLNLHGTSIIYLKNIRGICMLIKVRVSSQSYTPCRQPGRAVTEIKEARQHTNQELRRKTIQRNPAPTSGPRRATTWPTCIGPSRGGVRASIWNPRKKNIRWSEAHATLDARADAGWRARCVSSLHANSKLCNSTAKVRSNLGESSHFHRITVGVIVSVLRYSMRNIIMN
jgi:hypothetical protein